MTTNLPPKFFWSDVAVAKALDMRAKSFSASKIALALDPTGKLTRSAVIGKFQRLDGKVDSRGQMKDKATRPPKPEKPKATDIKPKVTRLTPVEIKSLPTPAPREPDIVLDPKIKTQGNIFTHLQSQCAYPVRGSGVDTFFCESPKVRGSYCEHHAKRCYVDQNKDKAA